MGLAIVIGAILGGLAYVGLNDSIRVASSQDPPAQRTKHTEFVGLAPDEIAAGDVATERLSAWTAQHRDANVLEVEPVYENGLLRGYWITYEE